MATKTAFIVIDHRGNPWGPFDDAHAAAEWAAKKWPDKESTDIGKEGWTVVLLWAPQ